MTVEEKQLKVNKLTSIIYAMSNIQEGYIVEIRQLLKEIDIENSSNPNHKDLYKFNIRENVELISNTTISFRNNLNRHYKDKPHLKLEFGEATDMLEELIDKTIKENIIDGN